MTILKILFLIIGIIFIGSAFYLFIYAFTNIWFGLTWEFVMLAFLLFIAGATSLIFAARMKKPYRYR